MVGRVQQVNAKSLLTNVSANQAELHEFQLEFVVNIEQRRPFAAAANSTTSDDCVRLAFGALFRPSQEVQTSANKTTSLIAHSTHTQCLHITKFVWMCCDRVREAVEKRWISNRQASEEARSKASLPSAHAPVRGAAPDC
jgi:hypothetical protein